MHSDRAPLVLQQQNFKQKVVALLRRFKVSDEVRGRPPAAGALVGGGPGAQLRAGLRQRCLRPGVWTGGPTPRAARGAGRGQAVPTELPERQIAGQTWKKAGCCLSGGGVTTGFCVSQCFFLSQLYFSGQF